MIRRVLLFGVLVVMVLSACAESAPTVPEYAGAIEEVTDAYIAESQMLSATFQRTVEGEVARILGEGSDDALGEVTDVTKREMVLYLALLEDAMGRYVDGLSEIRPPGELAETHTDYLDAVESVYRAMPATRASVESALHLDGIEGALAGSGVQDGQPRLTSTCRSLEASVRAEGTGLDLGCNRPIAASR
ncbi:MAG: hypothetical protein ACC683_11245 [Acidimicrobiia bacterium]